MTDRSGTGESGSVDLKEDGTDGNGLRSLTRRRVLAGSALFVGGGASTIKGTSAMFFDSDDASGSIQIDGDPSLAYTIVDESQYNNAEYEIAYQVEWVSEFDRIEIRVENVDDENTDAETLTGYSAVGTLSYPGDGGAEGDLYAFDFDVYETGSGSPVLTDSTTDQADGSDQSEGDMGHADDPELDSFEVVDETEYNTTDLTVNYQLSNKTASNFSEVAVTFDNNSDTWPDETSSDYPQGDSGSVDYTEGGTEGDTYTITVEVRNENGLAVDSGEVNHVSGASNSQWPNSGS